MSLLERAADIEVLQKLFERRTDLLSRRNTLATKKLSLLEQIADLDKQAARLTDDLTVVSAEIRTKADTLKSDIVGP